VKAALPALALLLAACGEARVSDAQTGISLRVPTDWTVRTDFMGMALWARPGDARCPGMQLSVTRLPPAPAGIDDATLLDDRIRRLGFNSHDIELIHRGDLQAELRHRQGSVAQQLLLRVHSHDAALDVIVAAADPSCFAAVRRTLERVAGSYRSGP
jgi:hypothetical protein